MNDVGNISQLHVATGKLVPPAALLGEAPQTHHVLAQAEGAATTNLLDSADISAGLQAAGEIEHKISDVNGSAKPAGIHGPHPVIDGIAEIRQRASSPTAYNGALQILPPELQRTFAFTDTLINPIGQAGDSGAAG